MLHGNKLYRVPEAADVLNVSVKTLWSWIGTQKIGVTRLCGRSVRISQQELDRIVADGSSPARNA